MISRIVSFLALRYVISKRIAHPPTSKPKHGLGMCCWTSTSICQNMWIIKLIQDLKIDCSNWVVLSQLLVVGFAEVVIRQTCGSPHMSELVPVTSLHMSRDSQRNYALYLRLASDDLSHIHLQHRWRHWLSSTTPHPSNLLQYCAS